MARQSKPIKWDEVIQRMEAGNSALTIANAFDIPISTFYQKFIAEFDCTFPDKKSELIESRDHNIAYQQYKKAMQGNDRMLIWLGQVWLGQTPAAPNAKPSNSDYQIQVGSNDPGVAIGVPAEELPESNNQSSQ